MSNPTTSRRAFLRNTAAAGTSVIAGIALVGCASRAAPVAAWRPSPGDASAARVPVEVAGRRVRTIDVHAHCYIPEALALLGAAEAKATLPPVRGQQQHFIVVDERLAAMDAMGIDMEVLSINPFWYRQARSNAESICRLQNDKLAELCRARPDRFGAFASLALQYPISQWRSSTTRSGGWACGAQPSAAAWRGKTSPRRASIPSGRKPKSLARRSSSILRVRPS